MSVLDTLKKIKSAVKSIRPVRYVTDGKLPFCEIKDIRTDHEAVQMIAELQLRQEAYDKAAKTLGVSLDYDEQFEYTTEEYIDDIKLRLEEIRNNTKKRKLEIIAIGLEDLKTRKDKVVELEEELKDLLD